MAAVRATSRGRFMARREDGQRQDGENERYVRQHWSFGYTVTDDFLREADQQIAQLYELMQAIRKQGLEEIDSGYKPER